MSILCDAQGMCLCFYAPESRFLPVHSLDSSCFQQQDFAKPAFYTYIMRLAGTITLMKGEKRTGITAPDGSLRLMTIKGSELPNQSFLSKPRHPNTSLTTSKLGDTSTPVIVIVPLSTRFVDDDGGADIGTGESAVVIV